MFWYTFYYLLVGLCIASITFIVDFRRNKDEYNRWNIWVYFIFSLIVIFWPLLALMWLMHLIEGEGYEYTEINESINFHK